MRQEWRAVAAPGIALLIVVAVAWRYRDAAWPPLRVAGAVVAMGGIVILCVARYQLGRSFSLAAQARCLVTTGIYSFVRHPIYVGGEMVLLGAAMFLPSWVPLLLVAVTVPVQMVRARREEAVLRAAFGERYERYRRSTWL